MSLFPRHLRPGDMLTIHLRIAPRPTSFPLAQVTVVDPTGRSVFEHLEQLPASIPEPDFDAPVERQLADGLSESPPLLFVAQHLRHPDQRATLLRLLSELHRSIHWYLHFRVPDDAVLGTYRVDTACWVDGHKASSPTAADDKFFVERVTRVSFEMCGDRHVACVRNHSPDPTPARLHRYARHGNTLGAEVERIVLPGASVTELELSTDTAMLAYAEDQGRLWLHGDEDPVCVRDQSCAFMPSRNESVVVTSGLSNKSYTLTRGAREIWLQAIGDKRRSELRALDPCAFDALLRAGLLRELTGGR